MVTDNPHVHEFMYKGRRVRAQALCECTSEWILSWDQIPNTVKVDSDLGRCHTCGYDRWFNPNNLVEVP